MMIRKHISQREFTILILCIVVIFMYGSYVIVFKKLAEKLILTQERVAAAEQKLRKTAEILQKESVVDAQYKQYATHLRQTSSDEEVMASILSEINTAASTINIRLADLKPKRTRKVDFYNNFSVSLTVDGEFLIIMRFLHILQNEPHRFGIEEIRLDKGSARTSEIKCRLVLNRIRIP